jgi:hypothetical protein
MVPWPWSRARPPATGVVPAGTRNHLAMDLGLDRGDVVGALDAYGVAVERAVDLGDVDGRPFVNNVSLGRYAEIIRLPAYRDAKVDTTLNAVPGLLGPGSRPFDLRFTDPAGKRHLGAHLVQVSVNRYGRTVRRLALRRRHRGSRPERPEVGRGPRRITADEPGGRQDLAAKLAECNPHPTERQVITHDAGPSPTAAPCPDLADTAPAREPRTGPNWRRTLVGGLVLWVATAVVTFVTGNANLIQSIILWAAS